MKQRFLSRDVLVICAAFVASRIIISLFEIKMDYASINVYWQYVSMDSLQNHLLRAVWYNHTQPPLFNLFLGSIIKASGSYAAVVFFIVFKLIGLANILLLYSTSKAFLHQTRVPFILALVYLFSPATMIFENELFYTTFITFFLLAGCYNLVRFSSQQTLSRAWGIFIPLSVCCLTRSMYHISWLLVVAMVMVMYFKRSAFSKLMLVSVCCTVITGSWYLKNYIIFGKFTTSTWFGMNMARNVFHDFQEAGSTHIEDIEPFSRLSSYKPFISGKEGEKFAGLNDVDLLREYKNGTHINENHISYIEVSEKYAAACKLYIKKNPGAYLKNVLQSSIIFFAPATRYPYAEAHAKKIIYYDVLYSFNLTHFANGKQERRIALVLSAIPKIIMYALTFGLLLLSVKRTKTITALNLFIVLTFAYIFTISSLFEHFENMRFRYEIEPMYLLLLAQVIERNGAWLRKRRNPFIDYSRMAT